MKNQFPVVFNSLILIVFTLVFSSCDKLVEKAITEPEPVDLTIEIDGKKTEMTSIGFTYFDAVNAKRELRIPFAKSASLLTVDMIEISIPSFREGKAIYRAQRGEVVVTYKEDVEVYEDESPEWKSEDGTLEITGFEGQTVEGKLTVTMKTAGSSKTKEFKSGTFKAKKLQ